MCEMVCWCELGAVGQSLKVLQFSTPIRGSTLGRLARTTSLLPIVVEQDGTHLGLLQTKGTTFRNE